MIAPQNVAAALDNSEFTIHRWIRQGKIRAVRLSSRCTRIDGDSLADFLEANGVSAVDKGVQPAPLARAVAARNAAKAADTQGG